MKIVNFKSDNKCKLLSDICISLHDSCCDVDFVIAVIEQYLTRFSVPGIYQECEFNEKINLLISKINGILKNRNVILQIKDNK
ncbi:MAG: hypothetical protein WC934_12830 [Acidithiobacillus sp.]|jgi:hypothetical protein|uniref:hypothetical protein n=1 Tax=Acidithiobacillus sp. TaxID=1872118 RepID=UPI00355D0691